jgi:hypothetical protein
VDNNIFPHFYFLSSQHNPAFIPRVSPTDYTVHVMTAMPWVGGTFTVAVKPHRVGLLQPRQPRQRTTRQRYR